MNPMFMAAGQFALDRFLFNSKKAFSGTMKIGLGILAAFALVLFFAGYIFFNMSLYAYMDGLYTPELTTLFMGGALLIQSIVFALILYVIVKVQHNKVAKENDPMDLILELLEAGGEDVAELIRNNPKTAVTLASLLGAYLGQK